MIRRDGTFFGTLCSLDTLPSNINKENLPIFTLLSKLIAYELEAEEERLAKESEIDTLNDLISIAAHDLRQPFSALQLRAYLATRQAKKENASPELVNMIDSMGIDIRRATNLTDILLDVGRIGSGNFALETAEVNLSRLITSLVEEQKTASPNTRFETGIPGDLIIQGDETRLGQVVRNLLDNAIKYSPGSKKVVEVCLCNLPGQKVFLQVRDYGMGVKEADLNNLFNRQFRTQQAKDSGIKGSGFGLYISRKIVEAHQGQIWADLPAGGGLRFNVILPAGSLD